MSSGGGPAPIPKPTTGYWTATNFHSSPLGPKMPDPLKTLRKQKLRG